MITNKMYTWFLIGVATLCSSTSVLFSAVFVVTNTNNQGPGSLRQAIENVNTIGGATNEILISLIDGKKTVFLLSELPPITNQVMLNGLDQVSQQPIIIDGNNNATIGLLIAESNASNTVITNTVIQNITSNNVNSPAYGISITRDANGCSIVGCTIQNISSGTSSFAEAAGIKASSGVKNTGAINNNVIVCIQSQDNLTGTSGQAHGIAINSSIEGDCNNNTISNISSGNSNQKSGVANGIITESIAGSCSNNIITKINSGASTNDNSAEVTGISISGTLGGDCSDNIISYIQAGHAQSSTGSAIGIDIATIQDGSCNRNVITEITGGNSEISDSGFVLGVKCAEIAGTYSNNIVQNITSGSALSESGSVTGVEISQSVGAVTHNTIENLHSGYANDLSGDVNGILIETANGHCSYNKIDSLSSSSTTHISGSLTGISLILLDGNFTDNSIKNLVSGDESNGANRLVVGVTINFLSGDFLNNHAYNLTVSQPTAINSKFTKGLLVNTIADSQLIACNQISLINGGSGSIGLQILSSKDTTINLNTISNIHAQGHAIGFQGESLDSLITHNNIFDIASENDNGFGIDLIRGSTDNNILTNSIFNINTKAINIVDNGLQTDVLELTLTTVRCSAGNRIGVTGTLIPQPELADRVFLIQFFVSDSNTPEQIKTFIGEYKHEPSSDHHFKTSFVVQAPTKFGQFITATATALPEGSGGSDDKNNINTSEVSNALFACETQGGMCTIATCSPKPKPTPPTPCPLLANCPGIDLL